RLRELLGPPAGEGGWHRVGVALTEGAALPLVELAVLLAAAAVVPLDPEEPPARLHHLADDASLSAVVVEDAPRAAGLRAALGERVRAVTAPELLPSSACLRSVEASQPSSALDAELPAADAVSHVFFTSGSTGRPKGCVCTHGNLAAYCEAKNSVFSVDSSSIVFVASAHTFDPSFGDFFATWAAGGCVALAPRAAIGSALGQCLRESGATHLLATPALFGTLEVAGVGPRDVPALGVVALGGELMSQRVVDAWSGGGSGASGVRLLNVYGVTECTVYQASAPLSPGSSPRLLRAAFPGTELLLASGDGADPDRRVEGPGGGHGELWIAGPQVGAGYLARPELTRARFLERPGQGRRFRTGDIAAAVPGGGWSLVGRRDGMVKLRGNRVELGEIEEVLMGALPDLLHACAVALSPGPRLVAWCVPRRGAGLERAADARDDLLCELMRLSCEERLPRHMVPAAFALTASLPTTGTGKVSRRELAARQLPEAGDGALAPRRTLTAAERLVADAWAEVLGAPVRSAGAHFHALGGDSLAALRVCRRLAAALAPSAKVTEGAEEAAEGGAFGELLPEPLLPAALLRQPRLAPYARGLQAAYPGQLAEEARPPAGEGEGGGEQEEDEEALEGGFADGLAAVLQQAPGG
ncbi:unnamed protein product, partial [Prorocentrum cordatum]